MVMWYIYFVVFWYICPRFLSFPNAVSFKLTDLKKNPPNIVYNTGRRFHGEKKDELMGIAFNRLMRMSIQFGDHIKTWRFNTIKVGLMCITVIGGGSDEK
jgi:hypothetical protein